MTYLSVDRLDHFFQYGLNELRKEHVELNGKLRPKVFEKSHGNITCYDQSQRFLTAIWSGSRSL